MTDPSYADWLTEHLCRVWHDAHDTATVRYGRQHTTPRRPWAMLPDADQAATREAMRAVLRALDAQRPAGQQPHIVHDYPSPADAHAQWAQRTADRHQLQDRQAHRGGRP